MKAMTTTLSVCVLFAAVAYIDNARAADAAFEADSARLANLLKEPQKGDRLLWMRKSPFVAERGKLAEHRRLAKSLLARMPAEQEGADDVRKEALRRRAIVWQIIADSPEAPARLSPTPFCGELQESALSFDRPGEYGAFVDDPLASDGRAIKMFNSHHQWCAMLMMNRIAFEPGVKYRLRARLRCAATARGNAFTAGVFDERTWKLAGQVSVRADRMSPDYVWYDICTFVPNDGEYFWIAPGKLNKNGDKDANALWLDKISFEPVPEEKLAIIPAPQKMTVTGGECHTKAEPKVEKVASIPPEGYELSITKDGVTIRSSDDAGAFYAKMTLAQIEKVDPKTKQKIYPCVEIVDAPKFKWRGVNFDDARHFFGKDVILHILEQMSWFKLNVFHWHITDDQYWPLEIPGFPELQQYGGECLVAGQSRKYHGEKVSPGIYTANDVREIVAYAKARHITVVPEIEFPGHSVCALCAYPQLACDPQYILKRERDPSNFGGGGNGVLCIGNPDSIRFIEKVLDHVCEIFPSEVIHIGGDECPRTFWEKCPKCQTFVKSEGLTGIEQIQPWVTRHFTEYLAKKGRRAIGWDEIFIESKNRHVNVSNTKITSLLPKSTMGMCYRVQGAGVAAANQGYDIVMTPHMYTYFDYRQNLPEDPYMYFGGVRLPLSKVYQFDPLAGVDATVRPHIVGGQCCNWTSHTFYRTDLEWKLWPRGLALAEVLWTYPAPAKRDFAEFSKRAAVHRLRLIRAHVNCAPLK